MTVWEKHRLPAVKLAQEAVRKRMTMANKTTRLKSVFEVAKLYVLSHLDSMHPNITVEQIQTAINKVGNALKRSTAFI